MLLIAHSAVANSPQSTHVSRLLANLEPLASECEIVAAYGVAKRMLRTVQQRFFCDDGPRRLTPSPYGGNAESGAVSQRFVSHKLVVDLRMHLWAACCSLHTLRLRTVRTTPKPAHGSQSLRRGLLDARWWLHAWLRS